MKKLDYLILVIIFLIVVCLYVFYFTNTSTNSKIEIRYKDNVLYTGNIDDDINMSIRSVDHKLITVIDNYEKILDIETNHDFYNELVIKDGKVNMVYASCPNKNCMNMEISKFNLMPIICTNGIVIKYINDTIEIIS